MFNKFIDGRTDLVFDIVNEGVPPDHCDSHGVSLIQWCAYYGDVSAIKYLISLGVELQSLGENLGLNSAVFHGHWTLCQFLLENGADVNVSDVNTSESLLHVALCKANRPVYEKIVELLLHHGVNVNSKTLANKDTGCFMRATKTKGESPLHRAAAFGSENVIQQLIEAGANVRAQDINGDVPLAWASWHLRPASILKMLCFDEYTVHPGNRSTYDHGQGWNNIDYPMGKLHHKIDEA